MNRPHFHVWFMASTERAFFKGRGFHTKQAARQYGCRRYPADRVLVRQCTNPNCKPPLD